MLFHSIKVTLCFEKITFSSHLFLKSSVHRVSRLHSFSFPDTPLVLPVNVFVVANPTVLALRHEGDESTLYPLIRFRGPQSPRIWLPKKDFLFLG